MYGSMPQLTLSKSTYLKEAKKLANYQRYLPALDLKRQQLMLEKNKAQTALRAMVEQRQHLLDRCAEDLPMLANDEIPLAQLITIKTVDLETQNVMGVSLPRLVRVEFNEPARHYLTQPHWVDLLLLRLRVVAELTLQQRIQTVRLEKLTQAARKATQRVNLVARVLIPEASQNINKIRIFLADNERAAVVRAKIAKRKKQTELASGADL